MKKTIRILIADDHVVVRVGLATMLDAQARFDIVGQAKNGREAVDLAIALKPDVVIMDLRMPVLDGIAATAELRSKAPESRILILTTFGTSDGIAKALAAGAAGALMKTAENEELIDCIRRVANGEKAVSPEVKRLIRADPPLPPLSERQEEVLRAMSKGLTSKEIAARLGLQKDSVDKHVNALIEKTGAANRTEAVAIALRKHLLKI